MSNDINRPKIVHVRDGVVIFETSDPKLKYLNRRKW